MPRATRSSARRSKTVEEEEAPTEKTVEQVSSQGSQDGDTSMEEDPAETVANGSSEEVAAEETPTMNGEVATKRDRSPELDAQDSSEPPAKKERKEDEVKTEEVEVKASEEPVKTEAKKEAEEEAPKLKDEGEPASDVKEENKANGTDVEMKEEESTPAEDKPEEFVDRDRRILSKMPSVKDSKLTELEKYWKPIKEDPYDFTGWTYLLQYVDQGEDVEAATEVYREFLARYPYCYGYWKKYADYLKKRNNLEGAEKVFDEGLKAIPLSVDLWLHFVNHARATYEKEENGESRVREAFERAAAACGLEFRSNKFWEVYIKWETEKGNFGHVMRIYERLLAIPTANHQALYQSMKDFVNEHNPKDYLEVDEFIAARKEALAEFRAAHGLDVETPVVTDGAGDEPPGDDAAPPGDGAKTDEPVQKLDEESKSIREKVLVKRAAMYAELEKEIKKRQPFEDALKRPYFHVKPLEKGQLKTWREYLDFEIQEGDKERIRVLFERCFIACALYEEFWLKYVEYLESIKADPDVVAEVFHRSCTIHLRKRLSINLQWAIWEERRKNYEKAMQVLDDIEDNFGVCLAIVTRKIGLARRFKKLDEVENVYEKYIQVFTKRGTRPQADALSIKLARFVDRVLKDRAKAEKIIADALERSPDNPRLYSQLVDILFVQGPERNAEILAIFDRAMNSDLPNDIKLVFAHRKMEFLEDFGEDVAQSEQAYDEYAAFIKKAKEDRKRVAQAEGYDEKKARSPADKSTAAQPSTIAIVRAPSTTSPPTTAPASTGYPSYGSYGSSAPAAPAGYSQPYPNYSYGVGYQQNSAWNYGSSAAQAQPQYGSYSSPNYGYNYYAQR